MDILLILAIFQYGLANILFSIGIKKTDSVEASLLLSIEPVFNPIPVAIFCGEHMSGLAIFGSAIVIVSIALYSLLPKLQQAHPVRRHVPKGKVSPPETNLLQRKMPGIVWIDSQVLLLGHLERAVDLVLTVMLWGLFSVKYWRWQTDGWIV